MQPTRDPADTRFWPQADGGTGFHRGPGSPRYQYSALRERDHHRNLVTDHAVTLPSIVTVSQDYTPETLRSRARAVLSLALERVERTLADDANELRLTELAPTVSALGRISGVAQEEQKQGDIRIHIVRDALPEHVQSRMLASGGVNAQVQAAPTLANDDGDGVTDGDA